MSCFAPASSLLATWSHANRTDLFTKHIWVCMMYVTSAVGVGSLHASTMSAHTTNTPSSSMPPVTVMDYTANMIAPIATDLTQDPLMHSPPAPHPLHPHSEGRSTPNPIPSAVNSSLPDEQACPPTSPPLPAYHSPTHSLPGQYYPPDAPLHHPLVDSPPAQHSAQGSPLQLNPAQPSGDMSSHTSPPQVKRQKTVEVPSGGSEVAQLRSSRLQAVVGSGESSSGSRMEAGDSRGHMSSGTGWAYANIGQAFDSISHASELPQAPLLAQQTGIAGTPNVFVAELTGLLRGDSAISSSTQVYLDSPSLKGSPTSQESHMRSLSPPAAHAAPPSLMTHDLQRTLTQADQPSAAASHAPDTSDPRKKKRSAESMIMSQGPDQTRRNSEAGEQTAAGMAVPQASSRKRKAEGGSVEDAAALVKDLDDVLFGMEDDMGMDIDGSVAELADGFTAPCLNTANSNAPVLHSQPIAASPRAAGGDMQPGVSQGQSVVRPAAGNQRRQIRVRRSATGSTAAANQSVNPLSSAAAGQSVKPSSSRAAPGQSVNPLSRAVAPGKVRPPRPANRTVLPPATSAPAARGSAPGSSPSPGGSPTPTNPPRAQAGKPTKPVRTSSQGKTRYPTQVRGCPLGSTREFEEGQMVWAQPKGYTFWPAMVSHPVLPSLSAYVSASLANIALLVKLALLRLT